MKKKLLMLAGFWLCLLGPSLLFPFLKTEADTGTGENRKLAEFPAFSLGAIEQYPAALESFINDHAAFRNRFLSLNAALNLELFGYPDSAEVIKGTDGWYFYAAGASVADCLGTNRYADEELALFSDPVSRVYEYFKEQDIDFVLLLPPNKEAVYREYLPDAYAQVSSPTRREQIVSWLRENCGAPIIDPAPYFKENKNYQWYFKTDTHWNDAGGFAASQMLIKALGGDPVSTDDVTVTYLPAEPGDLGNLFHMPKKYCDDSLAVISNYHDGLKTERSDVNGDGGIIHMTTPGAPDKRRVSVFCDSFGFALSQTLCKYFESTDFYHWNSYTPQLLAENPPDVVVYEVLERDLGKIPGDMALLAPDAFAQTFSKQPK